MRPKPLPARTTCAQSSGALVATLVATLAAALAVAMSAGLVAGCSSATDSSATSGAAPGAGWVAHSAYGLQLSVPRQWAVRYFASCPVPGAPGTLIIGSPQGYSICPDYGLQANFVLLAPERSRPLAVTTAVVRVHGVRVQAFGGRGIDWYVPSHSAGISGSGPLARQVAGTLAPAAPGAVAAPGLLAGSVYSGGLEAVPATGPVEVTRIGARGARTRAHPTVVHAFFGQFSSLLPPGNYRLGASAGNAVCPPVAASVSSGMRDTAPAIYCNGD